MSRIGLFGGAFDPPHNGHIAMARCALEQLRLDQLRVLPTGQAWHKERVMSAAVHRIAMAELAFGGLQGVVVDRRETRRPGPTYTVDTLAELQAEFPSAELFLVIGADQAAALTRWHRFEALLDAATICIARRDQLTPTTARFDFESRPGARSMALQMPPMAVSATEIRQRVAAGLGVAHLVPEAIARYIDQHQLYQTT